MRLRRVLTVTVLTALLALLLVNGAALAQDDGGEGDPDAGAELYAENCVVCHGEQGEGRAGATLNAVYGGINPDAFLRTTISRGVEGTFMPPWSQEYGGPLDDEQIDNLVAYIESWGTAVEPPLPAPRPPQQEIPPVPEIDGDPNEGYAIYQVNCVACHGEQGEGRVGATLRTAFAGVQPDAFIIQTISRGRDGTLMPPFSRDFGGPLSEDEIQDVAAYVLSLEGGASPLLRGEVVGRASAWPLVAVLVGTLILIAALGVSASRRSAAPPESGGKE